VDLSAPELAPCYDPVSHLVYAAGREHVSHVWIDGEARVAEGDLLREGLSGLNTRWEMWQNALQSLADS
jgi:5-methylthioadenosine/S-adenosylhomocysteine deaminase